MFIFAMKYIIKWVKPIPIQIIFLWLFAEPNGNKKVDKKSDESVEPEISTTIQKEKSVEVIVIY